MTDRSSLPFMSIVVICYNHGSTLGRTLASLRAQDYPRDKFEIIVVNDGSTDSTSAVARQFQDVRCVELPKNEGISGARNAGLAVVTGDIYVALDADCIVSPDWLRQLANGYSLHQPAGVGGFLEDLQAPRGLTKRYLSAMQSGSAPAVTKSTHANNAFGRLWRYLIAGMQRFKRPEHPEAWVEVTELYGANCSFPVTVLRGVGGWQTAMSGVEDRDVSLRIRQKYPDRHFYAMRTAKMMHDPDISLAQQLLRSYRRGPVNLRFHRTYGLALPIFPSPLFLLLTVCVAAVISPLALALDVLLLPQLLYFWWPYAAMSRRQGLLFVFPYIQLAEEAMVIIGILRGYSYNLRDRYAHHKT